MADLGHPGAVARVAPGADQAAVWEMRKAGLNIVMSMKGDAKPVSFVEDLRPSPSTTCPTTPRA